MSDIDTLTVLSRASHGVRRLLTMSSFGRPLSDLENRLNDVLKRCERLHITLSHSKFQIDKSLKFAGCIVSDEEVKPDPDRVSALSNFPVPTDQTGVRFFLGLCNQLAFFVPYHQHHTVAL